MLIRRSSSHRQDTDWFMFSTGLMHRVCSDYVAMRMLYRLGRPTTTPTICVMMIDIVEKSLKLHLAVQSQTLTALSDMKEIHRHNVESLRRACAKFHPLFDEPDVREFTRHLNDPDGKLYQKLRYGSQETTTGFKTNIGTLLPVVDKVFVQSILLLSEEHRRLLVGASPIKLLLTRSPIDQSQYPEQTIEILADGNAQFPLLMDYCQRVEQEQAALIARIPQDLLLPVKPEPPSFRVKSAYK